MTDDICLLPNNFLHSPGASQVQGALPLGFSPLDPILPLALASKDPLDTNGASWASASVNTGWDFLPESQEHVSNELRPGSPTASPQPSLFADFTGYSGWPDMTENTSSTAATTSPPIFPFSQLQRNSPNLFPQSFDPWSAHILALAAGLSSGAHWDATTQPVTANEQQSGSCAEQYGMYKLLDHENSFFFFFAHAATSVIRR